MSWYEQIKKELSHLFPSEEVFASTLASEASKLLAERLRKRLLVIPLESLPAIIKEARAIEPAFTFPTIHFKPPRAPQVSNRTRARKAC